MGDMLLGDMLLGDMLLGDMLLGDMLLGDRDSNAREAWFPFLRCRPEAVFHVISFPRMALCTPLFSLAPRVASLLALLSAHRICLFVDGGRAS